MTISSGWSIVVCVFAVLGIAATGLWTFKAGKTVIGIVKDLASVLREAVEVARAYREDIGVIRQIAQTPYIPNSGEETEPLIPQNRPPASVEFPAPYFGRFPQKPYEEDAPAEAARDVDVTGSEEEMEQGSVEQGSLTTEELERMKQQSREADEARIRDLVNSTNTENLEGQ